MGASISYRGDLWNKDQKPTKQIKDAAEETKSYALSLIRARSPVKTGALKAGWQIDVGSNGLVYRNEVPYTIYQEMGTRYIEPRAMLTQSLPEITEYFKEALARRIGKAYDARKKRRDRSADQRDNRRIREGTPRARKITENVTIATPTYDRLVGNE
jgi:hypothetical protein